MNKNEFEKLVEAGAFDFLDELRDGGEMDMSKAAPAVKKAFNLSDAAAGDLPKIIACHWKTYLKKISKPPLTISVCFDNM